MMQTPLTSEQPNRQRHRTLETKVPFQALGNTSVTLMCHSDHFFYCLCQMWKNTALLGLNKSQGKQSWLLLLIAQKPVSVSIQLLLKPKTKAIVANN